MMKRLVWTRVLLVVLAMTMSFEGLAASKPPHAQYTRSRWNVQDGLPEATVQALVETSSGTLWVGTTGGLTRFDGSHFAAYAWNSMLTPGVNSIFCLALAADGSLWVGTEGGGLVHLEKNTEKTYGLPEGLTDSFVRAILIDKHGTVWVGTDSGLFRVDGNRVERFDPPGELGLLPVHGLAEDREGRIWVGGSRLFSIEHGQTRLYTLPGPYSSNRVKTILEDRNGEVWVGTVAGLERLVNGQFERVSQIGTTVRALHQTTDGTLWIGTIGGGLWTYKDGAFTRLNGLLPSNTVLSILEDQDHQIWLGLQDGLVRLSNTPVRVIPLPGGTDADYETISGDGGGRIWAVASRVYKIEDGVAKPYTFKELPPSIKVRNVFRDREGELWVGTDGSGAYRIRPDEVIHYSAPQQFTNNFIRGFLETKKGDIWVATDEGVNRITAQGVRKLGVKDGLAYFSTRSLLEDSAGDVWIGTDQGLSHWHGDRFVEDAATGALRREKVWSILEDSGGTIWFGTRDHGLFSEHDGVMAHVTMLDGLLSNSIYQILEDSQRRIWLSGPSSISALREDQLNDVASGNSHHLSASTYSLPFGAEDAQTYGGRQPSGYVDQNGSVWFPSSRGAIHIALTPRSIAPPPKVVIEKVTLDGRDLPLTGPIHLPSSMTRLEFQFAPLSLRSQTGVRYRYKLVNFDKGWVYAGTSLTASYTNLPSGKYSFLVDAFDIGSPASSSEAKIDLSKVPVVWQRWWFLTLCVSALSLMVWLIHKARVHQVKLRFKAVLDERGRLAREMHDTVIQGCTSVSALLEAIASTRTMNGDAQDQLLSYARAQVRSTINEARQTVWNLRRDDELPLDLVEALRALADHTTKESGVHVECRAEGEPARVAGPVTRELLMVVREAVYNAVRHGAPQSITISVRFEQAQLALLVEDDGVGFRMGEAPAEGHFGMTGMRERLNRMGGALKVRSTVGRGTEVLVLLDKSLLDPDADEENLAATVSSLTSSDKPGRRRQR